MNRRSNICAPTLFEYTIHHFTFEQLAFLNRGPTYVPPCQVHISSLLNQDQILTQQITPLQQQLTKVFTRYPVNLSYRMKFENEIKKLFQEQFFSIPIPMSLQERSIYEKKLIQSIRIQLKSDQLILRRTADNNNTYYLGQLNEFNFQTQAYMEQHSDCYEIIGYMNENNTQLHTIIQSIDLALERLEQRKFITKDHLSKLSLSSKKNNHLKLPYLYFLPEIHENDGSISFQPRISSSQHSPIQTLATYLEQLLQPLFKRISRSTFIDNGDDFMKKCLHYSLRTTTTTQFITFEIHHLNTYVTHVDLRSALNHLLMNPLIYNRHDRLPNDGIEELTDLFLRNNIFTYNNKIYRHVKGCSFNFPLCRLLLDIYLYDWQFPLLRTIRIADEFYGLHHHIGFFTWNESIEKIDIIFYELNQSFQAPIHITFTNGLQSHFLNIHIENRTGHFYTHVYSNPNKQPFLLPYVTGHPRLIYRKWFRFALLRAGLYCTNVEDFQDERLNIELTFLANGYSLDFVEYHLEKFFQSISQSHISSFIELDQHKYDTLRSHLFSYISLQKQNLLECQQLEKQKHQQIQLDYLFDWGCRWKFNDEFYTKWIEILEKDPKFKSYHLKVHLHSKHCFLSNVFLAQ